MSRRRRLIEHDQSHTLSATAPIRGAQNPQNAPYSIPTAGAQLVGMTRPRMPMGARTTLMTFRMATYTTPPKPTKRTMPMAATEPAARDRTEPTTAELVTSWAFRRSAAVGAPASAILRSQPFCF